MPDRGSVLMLMPAAVLVVMILGAIAFDLSLVHLGEREVSSAASAAANDAVTHALDERRLYETGTYALDPAKVDTVIATSLAAQERSGHRMQPVGPPILSDADGDGAIDTVAITVEMDVDHLFAKAVPGTADTARVEATASATAMRP